MRGGNPGEGGSMVAGRGGRGSLGGGFGDAGCLVGGSRAVGWDRWGAVHRPGISAGMIPEHMWPGNVDPRQESGHGDQIKSVQSTPGS